MASFSLQQAMGLRDLTLSATMNIGGATAAAMIMHAAHSIAAGMAKVVACVFADAPLKPPAPDQAKTGSAAAYGFARGLNAAYGQFGVNAMYAFVAQRHMHLYGTKQDHLGAIAVAQRQWANLNPAAQFHDTPMSMADYHASRWVVEPFHLFDCCLVSNGGLAVIVTSAEQAKTLKHPPVYLLGMGQGHPGGDPVDTLVSGAPLAKQIAFKMADIELKDVNFAELYDCYTFTVLVTLEDYGFCKKGEGGPFVENGTIGPNGSLPVNTGGGELSSFYMWGMTPIAEAIVQMRGEAGRRQVPRHDIGLVSGNGGILSTHSTLVLGASA
jgi:acetyl-CoA acetyltransferase